MVGRLEYGGTEEEEDKDKGGERREGRKSRGNEVERRRKGERE